MKKNNIRALVILAAIFVAWQVIAFASPFVKNGTFWVSYLFADLAILAQAYILHIAFDNGEAIKSKIYGFPIARLGVIYAIVQLAVSLVCMILAKWAPAWVALIVDVLLLAAVVVGLSAADAARDEVERQDVQIKQSVSVIRMLQAKTSALAKQTGNAEIERLAEALRYSDPVSSNALAEVDHTLTEQITELDTAVKAGAFEQIGKLCTEAEQLLVQRNVLCKLSK